MEHEAADKYKRFDLNLRAAQDYELIQSFVNNKKAKRVFSAYVRLNKFFVDLVHGIPKYQKHLRNLKLQVVKIIDRVKATIGLVRTLRVFNISVSTYRQWSMETYTSCFHSIINTCNRIYPAQLSSIEINRLKQKLVDPANQYWPISSIAFQSLRDGSLPLSLNTWYKYSKRLGIARSKPNDRRKKTVERIRAERPNQIWHADITRFVTSDNITHYIYLVADNFSRKILSWHVSNKVSALIRREMIGDALKELKNEDEHVVVITDGGPENSLKEYLENLNAPVTHHRALIDVCCSNSLIEANFKVLKYNYLFKMPVTDGFDLMKLIPWIIDDFNSHPHISLDGLTPNEKYENITIDWSSLRASKVNAAQRRKEYNFKNRCARC